MDRKKIYNLLCEVIKEAELGKKECIREDFEEWRLCDHAWENIENLIEEIRKTITAENRAMMELSRTSSLAEMVDSKNGSIKDFPECDDIFGISHVIDTDISFEDRPFPGIL